MSPSALRSATQRLIDRLQCRSEKARGASSKRSIDSMDATRHSQPFGFHADPKRFKSPRKAIVQGFLQTWRSFQWTPLINCNLRKDPEWLIIETSGMGITVFPVAMSLEREAPNVAIVSMDTTS